MSLVGTEIERFGGVVVGRRGEKSMNEWSGLETLVDSQPPIISESSALAAVLDDYFEGLTQAECVGCTEEGKDWTRYKSSTSTLCGVASATADARKDSTDAIARRGGDEGSAEFEEALSTASRSAVESSLSDIDDKNSDEDRSVEILFANRVALSVIVSSPVVCRQDDDPTIKPISSRLTSPQDPAHLCPPPSLQTAELRAAWRRQRTATVAAFVTKHRQVTMSLTPSAETVTERGQSPPPPPILSLRTTKRMTPSQRRPSRNSLQFVLSAPSLSKVSQSTIHGAHARTKARAEYGVSKPYSIVKVPPLPSKQDPSLRTLMTVAVSNGPGARADTWKGVAEPKFDRERLLLYPQTSCLSSKSIAQVDKLDEPSSANTQISPNEGIETHNNAHNRMPLVGGRSLADLNRLALAVPALADHGPGKIPTTVMRSQPPIPQTEVQRPVRPLRPQGDFLPRTPLFPALVDLISEDEHVQASNLLEANASVPGKKLPRDQAPRPQNLDSPFEPFLFPEAVPVIISGLKSLPPHFQTESRGKENNGLRTSLTRNGMRTLKGGATRLPSPLSSPFATSTPPPSPPRSTSPFGRSSNPPSPTSPKSASGGSRFGIKFRKSPLPSSPPPSPNKGHIGLRL